MITFMARKMFLAGFVFILATSALSISLKTPAEESNFGRYSQQEDIARFLSSVTSLSHNISVQIVGKTRVAEKLAAKDIYLCILTEEGAKNPAELNRSKPTIFITASQHGDEQSAKEAALELIRDLTCGELGPMLKKLNLLIIPQANPYGNRYDQRENELGLDMNRDHLKLETEGVQAIHRVFKTWLPEVTLDVHERGDNYYRVALGCVSNINIHPAIQEFSRNQILAPIEEALAKQNITFHEYLVTEEMGLNTAAGAGLLPEDTAGREILMRYSTSDINDCRNSLGMHQTFSFIQEGASRHDLETLQERTRWQYRSLCAFMETVTGQSAKILEIIRGLRENLSVASRTYSETEIIHLRMEYERDDANPTLTIKEFKETDSLVTGVMTIARNSGDLLLESDVAPYPYSAKQTVVTNVVRNWFPRVVPKLSVHRPLGYVIPAAHADVIETLLRHGIEVSLVGKDCRIKVEAYEVGDLTPSKYDYLPPEKIEVTKQEIDILAKRGDFYIACSQPSANLIPCMLEPQSDYGMIRYWKFRLVPQKGDYFAFFRIIRNQDLPLVPFQPWTR
jgi:hypothetical protein